MDPRRSPGQRAGLSRDRVLSAARTHLTEHGLPGLTMRALAARLGVAPNALYSHVPDKAALVEALLDDALAAVPDPPEGVEWRTGLRDLMTATHEALLGSPDLVPLYLGRGARGANAQRLGGGMTDLLARGGVTGAEAQEALRVLIVYTIGFAAFEIRPGPEDADPAERGAGLAGTFHRGLEWLLAGIGGR